MISPRAFCTPRFNAVGILRARIVDNAYGNVFVCSSEFQDLSASLIFRKTVDNDDFVALGVVFIGQTLQRLNDKTLFVVARDNYRYRILIILQILFILSK